jgi:hypothetical protein
MFYPLGWRFSLSERWRPTEFLMLVLEDGGDRLAVADPEGLMDVADKIGERCCFTG